VGGRTLFRRTVHIGGANLNFKHQTGAITDAGVKALVPVGLGRGDVVLEPKRFGFEESVNGVEREIAVAVARDNDAEGEEVVDLFDEEVLFLHLPPHPSSVLGAALKRQLGYSVCHQRGSDGTLGIGAPFRTGADEGHHLASHSIEGLRVEDFQRRILEPSAELQFANLLRLNGVVLPDLEGNSSRPAILRVILLEQRTPAAEVLAQYFVFRGSSRAIQFERIEELRIDA
jgi:hypothetical protein